MSTSLRTVALAAAVVLATVGGWLLRELFPHPHEAVSPHLVAPPDEARSREPAKASPVMDMRGEIRRVAENELSPIVTARDLDRYLADLEVRARRNGQVTMLEVEPGVQAIRKIESQSGPERVMERIADFRGRMAVLSAHLDGRDGPVPPPDIDDLARQIERTPPEQRGPLNMRLNHALLALDPNARAQAFERVAPRLAR